MNEWDMADFNNADDWPIIIEPSGEERARLNQGVEACGNGLHRVQSFDVCVICGMVWETH